MPRKFDKTEWQLIRHSELAVDDSDWDWYDRPVPGLENFEVFKDIDAPEEFPDNKLNAQVDPNLIEIIPVSTFKPREMTQQEKGWARPDEEDPNDMLLGAVVVARCVRKVKPEFIGQKNWKFKDHEFYDEKEPARITLYLDQLGKLHEQVSLPEVPDLPPGYDDQWAHLLYFDNDRFIIRDNVFTEEEQYALSHKLHEFFAQFRPDDFKFGARWMPSDYEVQRGQFGNCLEWALAHQQAYPELGIGMHWFGTESALEPNHFFTHDGQYAYDTNGVHTLPYDSPDPGIGGRGLESGTEYNLSPEDAASYQKPREGRMPSREWILKYAPNPNQPPDVATPSDYIEPSKEIWDERKPWNNEEPNGWSPMSQHVNEDRKNNA